eukprot:IDg10897t1
MSELQSHLICYQRRHKAAYRRLTVSFSDARGAGPLGFILENKIGEIVDPGHRIRAFVVVVHTGGLANMDCNRHTDVVLFRCTSRARVVDSNHSTTELLDIRADI